MYPDRRLDKDYDTAIGSILQTIAEQVAAHHCMIFKYEEN